MGSKKTTKQTSHSTTTAAPPTWTAPGLKTTAGLVDKALAEASAVPDYTGNFVAAPDMGLVDKAMQAYQGSADLARQLAGKVNIDGYDLGPTANLSGVIDNAIDPVRRSLMEEWLPSIRSSSLDAGAYSGDRAMAVLPENAIRNAVESADRLAADITYKDYSDRENRRLQAYGVDQGNLPALMDTIMRMSTSEGDLITQALGLKTGADQAGIDNALAKDNYAVTSPFKGLDIATQLYQALSGNYGTTTADSKSKTVEKSGGLGSIVQGIAGLASAIGGAVTGLGGLGGALGTGMASKAATVFNTPRMTSATAGLNPFGQYLGG